MSPEKALALEKLYPSGKKSVAAMIAKGGIERRPDGYCITSVGQAALRTTIPNKRSR
jgi:hypothetical protein